MSGLLRVRARRWHRVPSIVGLAMLAVVAMLGCADAQERRALLVGVSRYDNLAESFQLPGPANDVVLAAAVLRENGFKPEHVRILAEAPVGESRPTRAAIMAALADLAAQTGNGDVVYLHFSGHGSQQPAHAAAGGARSEADMLDEILLPADVGSWDGAVGSVANAIVDDEIGTALAAIRAKGAFVWAVFDTCHSATMTRGVAVEDVRLRTVAPAALGVPDALDRGGSASASRRAAGPAGASVAFYAAQSHERAPEMRLPRGSADRKPHGLFSFTTLSVIAANPGITYRQAAQRVLQSYGADFRWGFGPLFEGSGLDAPVFGSTDAPRIRQWPIRRGVASIEIAAGAVHRIGEGAEFAVLPGPTSRTDEAIAGARAVSVSTFTSVLQATTAGGSALDPRAIPENAYARLIGARFRADLGIARPLTDGLPPDFAVELAALLAADQLQAADDDDRLTITWVAPDAAADLRLLAEPAKGVEPPRLWFLSPVGEIVRDGPGRTFSLALDADPKSIRRELLDSLARIAKSTNLLRLAGELGRPASLTGAGLTVALRRAGADSATALALQDTPLLHGGDTLLLSLVNGSNRPVDMTLLAIDANHGITPLYPAGAGEANRIEPRGEYLIEAEIQADTIGTERLVLIAVAAEPGAERMDFGFLAQPRLTQLRGGTARDPGARDLYALLEATGFRGSSMRGAPSVGRAALETVMMQVFTWSTRPRR